MLQKGGGRIERIVLPKASDILARQIRERILAGEFGEGEFIPNERDLAEFSGLSRTSVREALRILEVEGLITTRPGRNGGSVVCRPGSDSFARSLNLFIWGQQVPIEALIETRMAIEPPAARFAAIHRDASDLDMLQALHVRLEEAFDDVAGFRAANVEWHSTIVKASHNQLLIAFYNAMMDSVHAATDLEGFHSGSVRRDVIDIHHKIFIAIRDGDGEAAARRMQRHVNAYSAQVQDWAAASQRSPAGGQEGGGAKARRPARSAPDGKAKPRLRRV